MTAGSPLLCTRCRVICWAVRERYTDTLIGCPRCQAPSDRLTSDLLRGAFATGVYLQGNTIIDGVTGIVVSGGHADIDDTLIINTPVALELVDGGTADVTNMEHRSGQ